MTNDNGVHSWMKNRKYNETMQRNNVRQKEMVETVRRPCSRNNTNSIINISENDKLVELKADLSALNNQQILDSSKDARITQFQAKNRFNQTAILNNQDRYSYKHKTFGVRKAKQKQSQKYYVNKIKDSSLKKSSVVQSYLNQTIQQG